MQYLLFDNSALNHLFGQDPAIDEAMRSAVIERVATEADAGRLRILINLALLGELGSTYFSSRAGARARFDQGVDLVFRKGRGVLMRPFDQQDLRIRFGLEVAARGRAAHENLLLTGRGVQWVHDAFLGAKSTKIDKVAAEARKRKDTFTRDERRRKAEVDALLAVNGGRWGAVFRNFDDDPQAVIDEWTLQDMNKSPASYGLPADRSTWPGPRELPTLWYARAYHVTRLKEIGEGRACDDGGDLYDGVYFQDSVYADVFVTGDEPIIRRAAAARIARPRIMRTKEWVTEVTACS